MIANNMCYNKRMLKAVTHLAHAGEEHGGLVESTEHLLESVPYVVLIWLLFVLAAHVVTSQVFKLNLSGKLLTQATLHLILGLYLHDKHNVLAAIIISLGFALILTQVINGLSRKTTAQAPAKSKKTAKQKEAN